MWVAALFLKQPYPGHGAWKVTRMGPTQRMRYPEAAGAAATADIQLQDHTIYLLSSLLCATIVLVAASQYLFGTLSALLPVHQSTKVVAALCAA